MNKTPLTSGLLVIFGITGDLSRRYLLPALSDLAAQNLLPEQFEIIGTTRRRVTAADVLGQVSSEAAAQLAGRLRIVQMDPTLEADYRALKSTLDRIEDERGVCLNRLFYLSIPPGTYGPVVDLLGTSGLNTGCQHGEADSRVMIEKPFGYDLESARELIARIKHSFKESQIYRIDHYLAKETAQNILVFRFTNPIFEAVWDSGSIQDITITASETIGVEGRAAFYESTGALRDFVQNHLLQLLAITTMEKPRVLDSDHIHREKLKLLRSIRKIKPNKVAEVSARGQYRGYAEEVGNPDSTTETFARLKLRIGNERWNEVNLTLQTGKRLNKRSTEIVITFAAQQGSTPNTLRFRIQPDEGIDIDLQAKKPGLDNKTEQVEMAFTYAESFGLKTQPNAYERVLMDGIRGDQTLFATSDEVIASWEIVEAVVREWSKNGDGLTIYDPGTPAANIN
ncbi:MAG TPA: glucose-6-phosphate dehydrogenase [Candidatus Saccharimonadia bacterium]|jgi:glucose-6-phosphate 1-dehydrogenase